jgi:beta-glucosidase-like glycosyl hydrolase
LAFAQDVANGNLTLAAVQQAAYRFFRIAFAVGLFDPPGSSVYDSYGLDRIDTPQHRQVALEASLQVTLDATTRFPLKLERSQAMTLLQNNAAANSPNGANTPILPLPASKLNSIALIGPHANSSQVRQCYFSVLQRTQTLFLQSLLSIYVGGNTLVNSHTPLLSITARFGKRVQYAAGCADIPCASQSGFAAAVAAAQASDVAVVFVGLDKTQEDEGRDRVNITLPGQQEQLIQAIVATGKPVVVVLVS